VSLGVRLQNLRDFTVQIRVPGEETIVGTGIAVSMDGKVVTCAHVVEATLGVHPLDAGEAEVGVYFPQAPGGEVKDRRATIAGCFPQHDDDVVLLQLSGGPAPLAPEQIAVLGRAEDSCYHPFRSYGYRRLDKYLAGHAHGTILDCVEPPKGNRLLTEPVQLQSQQIDRGMSGAAVLDIERNLVVGVVSETWFPGLSPKDRDTGWAVNARALSLAPLGLPLRDKHLDKRPAPEPQTDVAAARAAVAPDLGVAWNNAPPLLPEWTGRAELLAALDRDWADPQRRVTGLIGFGGEGKSSLARQWVETLLSLPSEEGKMAPPDGVFWWGFYEKPSVDEFFEAAITWLGGETLAQRTRSSSTRAQVIGAMLGAGRVLFVLDGLEVMQHQDGDQYGLLRSADLRAFLELFAGPEHNSFCLLTSRAPLLDLMDYTTYTHRDVERLLPGDGRALLRNLGVTGADAALDQVVADWDGHALTLGLVGSYLADRYGGDVRKIDDLPPPTADEPRYQRVHRVLRRYDEHLTEAERAFLTLFSAFRTPVRKEAFGKVFRAPQSPPPPQPSPSKGEEAPLSLAGRGVVGEGRAISAPIAALDDAEFAALVERLVAYRKVGECQSMAHQAWAAHLSGDLESASDVFQQAEALGREMASATRYLYSNRGIFHADHLRRTGQADYARRVTEANLEDWVRDYKWLRDESQCHHVLGDLDADQDDHNSARAHYDQALKIARGISARDVLIEALLARGRWAARHPDLSGLDQASSDLNEALDYALEGGYRIYEADIRVALAWAHRAARDPARARQEAERAQQMSVDMGYHWGQVDAAEVLAALESV